MGIFKKKSKALEQAKGEKKELKIEHLHKGGGFDVLRGEIPEGVNINDPEQREALIKQVLKQANVIPEGVDIDSVKIKGEPIRLDQPEGMDKLLRQLHDSGKGDIIEVPTPQDPTKAAFVSSLNCLHRHIHKLGPMAAEVMTGVRCLAESVKTGHPSPRELEQFKGFEDCVASMMMAMARLGSEVCSLVEAVGERGIPAPDSSSLTIN